MKALRTLITISKPGAVLLAGTGAILFSCMAQGQTPKNAAPPPETGLEIVLLGTAGGPPPHEGRSQPANLLRVNGHEYLIDAGENVAQQLIRAHVPSERLDAAFISHLHWDHTLGLDYLMATGWMRERKAPLPIWGPPGLSTLVDKTASAIGVGEDIFRAQSPDRPTIKSLYVAHEINGDGPTEIYRDDTVRVRAVLNSHFSVVHGPPHSYGADKSYSYRFDTAQGCVTFTGDTGPSDAVAQLAKGCDVLVSEIVDVDSIRAAMEKIRGTSKGLEPLLLHMQQQHLSPEEVGKLAQQAGVKKVVLTHFVIGQSFDPAAFVAKIRNAYPKGDIIVGEDLMSIPVDRP